MLRLAPRLRISTFALLLLSSGAVSGPHRLAESYSSEASGGALDNVQLFQTFILQEVEPQPEAIAVMTANKTVHFGVDGQVTASAQPAFTRARWPASGPEGVVKRFAATQDSTVVFLIVFIICISTTMAVLVLMCLHVPLPRMHRRCRETVEFPEIGETRTLKTSMQQQQLKMLDEVTDDTSWQGCWAEAMLCKQTLDTASAVPDSPAPVPRLRTLGASYAVPIGCIKNATGTMLNFNVPILPPVWPLRAVLTRATPQSAWTKVDLTVDVIAVADLPALLSCLGCSPSGTQCGDASGCTGGTTSPGGRSGEGVEPCSQWLAVRSCGGAILASTTPMAQDPARCTLQLQSHDRVSWDVNMCCDDREHSVVISRLGQGTGPSTGPGHCSSQPAGEDSDASDDEGDSFLLSTFSAMRSAAEFHAAASAVRSLARDRACTVPRASGALPADGASRVRGPSPGSGWMDEPRGALEK
mmetsp:Transcript_89961/g.241261  ORF Transcript_89961/g.241261 Transcript_89961/m.241261 type:complete len:471 (+) Transcript_89961:130-1542(+)